MNLEIFTEFISPSDKSEEETQGILPLQKSSFDDEGVPPPKNSPNAFNSLTSHSSVNPGNLKLGTVLTKK